MIPSAPRLDDGQRAVLDLPVGRSAVVLGAPGSGRTTLAVELVAHRIRHLGLDPAEVLLLAPRRTQAARLRDRLLLRAGVPASGPLARTTASLAVDIARRSARIEGRPEPHLLTGGEQDTLVEQLLEGTVVPWPSRLGSEVRALPAFRAELRDLFGRATAAGLEPVTLGELGARHGRDEWVAAAAFWAEYVDVLEQVHPDSYDSAEIVALATGAVLRGSAGRTAERLRLVLVDDAQDAGEATVGLLRALAGRGCAVVALGDPDIAADTFRGGEPDLLGRFEQRLGVPVERYVLPRVHRHPASVRALVDAVTDHVGTALAGAQRRARAAAGGEPVRTLTETTAAREAAAIGDLLRERHLLQRVRWSDMAVVVRTAAAVDPLVRALGLAGVPARPAGASPSPSSDPASRALLDAAAAALGLAPLTPESVESLLLGPLGGLDRLDLRRLRLALRAEEVVGGGSRSAGALLVDAIARPGRLVTIDGAVGRGAARLADSLDAARGLAVAGASAEEVLWSLWERSGLAERWARDADGTGLVAAEANRALDAVVALFAVAARDAEREPDDPAAGWVATRLRADVADDVLSPRALEPVVTVSTPVGVAGQEFDTVAVAGLQEGVWPNLSPRGSMLSVTLLGAAVAGAVPEAGDARRAARSDELRLFTLAASRARRLLVLSAVENEEEAASVLMRLGAVAGAQPAPVADPHSLRPLVGALRRIVTSGREGERPEAAAALARLAAAGVPEADPAHWHGLLDPSSLAPLVPDPAATVAVSPSAVERFESSPLDWFVERVAGEGSRLAAAVGTLLHWVLETAEAPEPAALLAALEGRWTELDFEAAWVGRRERALADRMVHGIAAYLAAVRAERTGLLGSEQAFSLRVGRAEVRGTVDRIERTADGAVRILDLKTVKPGRQLKAPQAALDPQLSAYQLAVVERALPDVLAQPGAVAARLLYVNSATADPYRVVDPTPLDHEALARFRERLAVVAEGMAAAAFEGSVEPEERAGIVPLAAVLTRVPEVCGD